jgi:hypothetical protein
LVGRPPSAGNPAAFGIAVAEIAAAPPEIAAMTRAIASAVSGATHFPPPTPADAGRPGTCRERFPQATAVDPGGRTDRL